MGKFPEGLGADVSIKVNIPVDSDVYQAYLASLVNLEKVREENGEITADGLENVRQAVGKVDNLAQKIYRRERSN